MTDAPEDQLAAGKQQLLLAKNTFAGVDQIFDQPLPRAKAQWNLAVLVMWAWALIVGSIALFIMLQCKSNPGQAVPQLMELLKIGILPIVTFVIGHYFGSKGD